MHKKTFLTGLIPLKVISAANKREHWAIKHKRDRLQKNTVAMYLNSYKDLITLPCVVKLTRVAPRKLDGDNLQYAFKGIRDAVCSIIKPGLAAGRADDDERIQIEYMQHSDGPKVYGFKITIECENNNEENDHTDDSVEFNYTCKEGECL